MIRIKKINDVGHKDIKRVGADDFEQLLAALNDQIHYLQLGAGLDGRLISFVISPDLDFIITDVETTFEEDAILRLFFAHPEDWKPGFGTKITPAIWYEGVLCVPKDPNKFLWVAGAFAHSDKFTYEALGIIYDYYTGEIPAGWFWDWDEWEDEEELTTAVCYPDPVDYWELKNGHILTYMI